MSRSLRVYGGITKAANQQVAYIRITDHGLFAGDFVNFSNSGGVTGVTGNMTVTTVIDKNTFTVTTQNTRMWIRITRVDTGVLVHHFTRHHGEKPVLELFLLLLTEALLLLRFTVLRRLAITVLLLATIMVILVHASLGYSISLMLSVLPVALFADAYLQNMRANASEPCVKYYDGILYLTTGGH